MANLRVQKRLAASILKCGRRKIWLDPNEMSDINLADSRANVRKLIRDGFIIKKPQKVHSRFRARKRAAEKKKGRHLGPGKRKGTKNARNPVKTLWMRKQRGFRRLLRRYKEKGKIDRRMYHRLYLSAKGNTFKNKAALISEIDRELIERKREKALKEEYEARIRERKRRKEERDAQRKKEQEEQNRRIAEAQKRVEAQTSGTGDKKKRKRKR